MARQLSAAALHRREFFPGMAAIFAAATLFGVAGALAKALFHANISPADLTALRTWLACIVFGAVIAASPRLSFKPPRASLPVLLAAGVTFTLVNLTFYWAINLISVAAAITLEYTAPFFVLILSILARQRRARIADAAIVLFSVTGCFLLSWQGGAGWLLSPGILIGLACGFFFALYNLIGNACKQRGIGATTVTFYSFFISAILWLLALPWLSVFSIAFTLQTVLYTAFIVIFATALPYYLLLYGLRNVNALPATVAGMLDPLTAGVVAFFLLGETLSAANIAGIGIIIFSVCIFTAKESRKPPAP